MATTPPLSDRLPVSITPQTADRLLASALVNHDSHPDLVIIAATVAVEQKRIVFLDDLRSDVARDFGFHFGSDGYMVGR
jgi:hypothetical protein